MTAKNRMPCFLIIFLLLLSIAISPIEAAKEKFFPLNQVKPGMSGKGYTVFRGTEIESFDIKVIEVIEGSSNEGQLILVRLSGKQLETNGGLSAGMSGSPIYIKGKLAGAISYGFENADPLLAMVTPIQSMFNLLNKNELKLAEGNFKRLGRLVPVATPVMVSGLSSRSFQMLRGTLETNQLKPVFMPEAMEEKDGTNPFSVKPGSAIAVQMVSGDYQVTAIGTVTWTGKDYFLAFGHPFMNKGKVNYNVFQAKIAQTVLSRVMAFKIGSPQRPIGAIIEDRRSGIVGKFGDSPDMIEVEVNVKDLDRKVTHRSHFRVIKNEQLYPNLIISGTTAAIDKAIDRVGRGTAKVMVKFDTVQHDTVLARENRYYAKDIGASCLKDVDSLLNMIAENEFQKIDLKSVKIDVQIGEFQNSARVLKLETEQTKVKPGATIGLNATIHTYRGSNVKIPFKLVIPENIQPGKLVLIVRGGAETVQTGKDEEKQNGIKPDTKNINTFDQLLADYLETAKNDQLVLEYFPMLKNEKENSTTDPVRQMVDSDYYLTGEAQLVLEIE